MITITVLMIYGGLFEPTKKNERINELENKMNEDNFWLDKRKAEKTISELNNLKKILDNVSSLKNKIEDNLNLTQELKENITLTEG